MNGQAAAAVQINQMVLTEERYLKRYIQKVQQYNMFKKNETYRQLKRESTKTTDLFVPERRNILQNNPWK